ncbi:hypothetical protein BaRGS_00014645 [Batillaria attramentaria]|uniref:DNA-directed RNA polymerase n=1 Tax=Batillaria attramentaria TaxID=370345 RepID=A0ABD0L536_9CAEN
MSQLLRLHRYTRTFLASHTYSSCVSASVIRALEQLQPCHNCQSIRLPGKDVFVSSIRSTRPYSSGFPRVKVDGRSPMSKAQWKKKKMKTSKMNKKIHGELLSVLNKRAVQLLLDREEHQLHRTLVTNFSFTDFPLLTAPDASPVSEMKIYPPKVTSPPQSHTSDKHSDLSWESRFSSFDRQMKDVVEKTSHIKPAVHGLEPTHTSGVLEPSLNETVSDSQETFDELGKVSKTSLSDCEKQDLTIPHVQTQPSSTHTEDRTVLDAARHRTDHLEKGVSQQTRDTSRSKHSDTISLGRVPKPSVNANILKTKQVGKAKKLKSDVIHQASPAVFPLEDDIFLDKGETEESVAELEADAEDGKSLQEPSPAEVRRLQKARLDMEKFQTDPAKFNHLFNQELLAYVDACCFAGMESVAHNFLNVFHQKRLQMQSKTRTTTAKHKKKTLTNMKDVPDLRQIQDIAIYNRLLSAWSQWGRIEGLFSMLQADGLKPDMQSYAACLECLGRRRTMDMAAGEKVLTDMKNEGLDVKELFNKCVFYRDEQQFVLKALKALDPEYEPNPLPRPLPPSGPLVDDLATAWPKDQVCGDEGARARVFREYPCDDVIEKNPYTGVLPTSEFHRLVQTQMEREIRGSVTVKSILKQSAPGKRALDYRKKLESVREEWRGQLTKAVEKKARLLARRFKMDYNLTLYPYLKVLEPQEYAQCLLQEIETLASSSETFSPSKFFLWRQLSGRIHQKFIMMEKIRNKVPKKMSQLYKEYLDKYNDPDLDLDSHRQQWQGIVVQSPEGPSLLGKLLYDIILYDVKVDASILKGQQSHKKMVPAFYAIYRSYAHQTHEEIKAHPVVMQLYRGAEISELTFDTGLLPMLVPPVPWVSTSHGGFLLAAVDLVRLPLSAQAMAEKYMNRVSGASTELAGVLDSINVLSACAWTVNKQVLDVIIELFNNKGNASLDIPPPASECPSPPKITPQMTPYEKAQAQKQRQKLSQQRAEMYSLWCTELYRLSIANQYRDEVLWFPHNMDFRGRTYPTPPHFNHLGSDVTRSILKFAKGKPLGPKGLDWMKIHLVNLTGFKKRCSNAERLAYANKMMPKILDSADNPLTGSKWWQKSDEPWQTLACCMEIAKATRSADPEQYVCSLPIHQDGSCNGLQHYAALGRDKAGAQSVNLWPYDEPQDVYSDVCELVEKERQKDAAAGVEIAKVLEGYVRRKVIKQTVMTTVYGVTRYGAKAQILRQLKDIPEFPQAQAWAGSRYLTEKTFHCLNEMFSATKDIQDWLTLSAQLISHVCQRPVGWVTPLGLPVLQPYHKPMTMSRFGVDMVDRWNFFEKPNAVKQKNAFPPNFIHSLDSTHMMLTALYCMRAGITFVSVHDCFWTHACDVEIMNRICRQQFVALHKQPILEDLSNQLVSTYTPITDSSDSEDDARIKLRNVLASVPARGDFDLDKVLESTYFFS